MNLVGKFSFNNTNYLIVFENNKFKIGKQEGKNLSFDLEEYDKLVAMKIIDLIMPTKNIVNLRKHIIEDRSYDLYFNPSRNLYLFCPEPTSSDLIYLNKRFNYQSDVVYSNGFKNLNKDIIKRIVNVGKKTVVVILSAAVALSLTSSLKSDLQEQFGFNQVEVTESQNEALITILGDVELLNESDLIENKLKSNIDKNLISIEKIVDNNDILTEETPKTVAVVNIPVAPEVSKINQAKTVLLDNHYLTQEEKNAFLNNFQIIEDHLDYIDFPKMLNVLGTLRIKYTEEKHEYAAGTYTRGENLITMYEAKDFASCNLTVLYHEFDHSLQISEDAENSLYYSWLIEGTNALLNDEYYDDYAYTDEQKFIKGLIEIIGIEPVKKANFTDNSRYVADELIKLTQNEAKVYNFLLDVESMHDFLLYKVGTYEEFQVSKQKALEAMAEFYELKYGKNMEDDLEMLWLFDYEKFNLKLNERENLGDEVVLSSGLLENKKYYFNKKHLNESNNLVVSYPQSAYIRVTERLSLDEALEEGAAVIEDGIIIPQGMYDLDPTDNTLFRICLEVSEERNYIEINDNNRYLSNEMSR